MLTDHLSSTTATVNTATGGVERQLYKPYGEPRGPSTVPTDRQFTGQRAEAADYVGQVYDFNARLYSPSRNQHTKTTAPAGIMPAGAVLDTDLIG